MVEKRELVCIACPLGCHLQVTLEAGKVTKVEGKGCKRGIIYAEAECMHPARMLTTTVKVKEGKFPLVSVRSDKPLPKHLLLDCMTVIKDVCITAPVHIGDLAVENILGTGVNIIATRNVGKGEEKKDKRAS